MCQLKTNKPSSVNAVGARVNSFTSESVTQLHRGVRVDRILTKEKYINSIGWFDEEAEVTLDSILDY